MNAFSEKPESSGPNTKVLLCILKPSMALEYYTNSAIMEIFQRFGKVMGLRIIEKNVKLKAFVEFDKSEELELAKQRLHKNIVEGFGAFEIYPSRKASVSTSSTSFSEGDWQSSPEKGSRIDENPFHEIKFRISQNVNIPKNQLSEFGKTGGKRSSIDQAPTENWINGNSSEQSGKVLMLNRIDFTTVSKQMIANLLGCFGNVTKVITNLEGNFALVEMQNNLQARSVIRHLANQPFFGKPLKIKISKYASLSLKKMDPLLNPRLETLAVDPTCHRIDENSSEKMVPSTAYLQFSNLPKTLDPKTLFDLLSLIHSPLKLKAIRSDKYSTLSYLVQMEDASQASEILATFHGKQIDYEFIKASFSLSAF